MTDLTSECAATAERTRRVWGIAASTIAPKGGNYTVPDGKHHGPDHPGHEAIHTRQGLVPYEDHFTSLEVVAYGHQLPSMAIRIWCAEVRIDCRMADDDIRSVVAMLDVEVAIDRAEENIND